MPSSWDRQSQCFGYQRNQNGAIVIEDDDNTINSIAVNSQDLAVRIVHPNPPTREIDILKDEIEAIKVNYKDLKRKVENDKLQQQTLDLPRCSKPG